MATIYFLYMGCTLAPPEEYDWTIHVRRRCGLMSNYFDHLSPYLPSKIVCIFCLHTKESTSFTCLWHTRCIYLSIKNGSVSHFSTASTATLHNLLRIADSSMFTADLLNTILMSWRTCGVMKVTCPGEELRTCLAHISSSPPVTNRRWRCTDSGK